MRRMRKLRKEEKNYVIIFATVVLLLSVGYAYFAQPLAHRLATIQGNSNGNKWWDLWWLNDSKQSSQSNMVGLNKQQSASSDVWDIGFTKATKENVSGTASEANLVSYEKYRASFAVILKQPGDSITYSFKITNNGTLPAKVATLSINTDNDNNYILYHVDGVKVNDTLKPGESKNLKVKVSFNPDYEGDAISSKKNIVININYVQK